MNHPKFLYEEYGSQFLLYQTFVSPVKIKDYVINNSSYLKQNEVNRYRVYL